MREWSNGDWEHGGQLGEKEELDPKKSYFIRVFSDEKEKEKGLWVG